MKVDLSIVIVSWNVKPLLERCLRSILKKTKGISYEIFVVDNNSGDGSVEMVKSQFGRKVKLITNKINRGFARANNQAIKQARGKYILLLNPDTEIKRNALARAVKFMESSPDCGILGVQLLGVDNLNQPSVRRAPTTSSQLLILLKLQWIFPWLRPLNKYFARDFNYSKAQEVDQVMGAFLMTRQKVIDQVGLLDENFFLWFEEVDFCKRVRGANWKIHYIPGIQITHYGLQSFRQLLPLAKQKTYNRSMLHYFKKHHSRASWRLLRFFHPVSIFSAWLLQALRINRQYPYR